MRQTLKNDYLFKTSDINLAAVLSALGMPLIGIDRKEAGRSAFVFEDTPVVQHSVRAYWSKQLSIEPQALLSGLKALKARLYGERL